MTEKVSGYTLLVVGVLIIIFAGVNVFLVFSKKIPPVQFFNSSGISLDMGQLVAGGAAPTKTLPKQEVVSAELLNDSSNLLVHIFFMGFVASIGQRLGQLGVQLLRPIVISAKES